MDKQQAAREAYDEFKSRIGYADDPIIEPAIRHAFYNGMAALIPALRRALYELRLFVPDDEHDNNETIKLLSNITGEQNENRET